MRRMVVPLALLIAVSGCMPIGEAVFDLGVTIERERAGFERRTVEFDGYRIVYLERPAEGETIVLLHGFASEKDVWLQFTRYLPDEYRVIAVDMPGHGESSKRVDETYDVPYLVARFAEGIDEMGIGRFHLAGNSLGGMVALLYAHEHPDRVITLGLFDAAGVDPPRESEFERMLAAGKNPLIVDDREDFDALMALVFEEPPPMPWPVRMVLTHRISERADFHEKVWTDIWSRRRAVTGLLSSIQLPVFVLWGADDRILDSSSAEVFAAGLPDAEVHVLERTGHSPMIERPARTAALYRDFVIRRGDG